MANFNEPEGKLNITPSVKQRMKELHETGKWHDCVFKLWNSDGTGEELVVAHKVVLASCSPVFEALCFGPLAKNGPIEVPDIDPLAFKMMLKFIYTEQVEFNSVEMACNVLYAAKKYFIYSLTSLAVSYIVDHINERNCEQVYNIAVLMQEESLLKVSWSYLCSHLDDVKKHFYHESLTVDLVKNLLNEEALNGDEITLYKICLMWAEAVCENNNLVKNCNNLRKVLIEADLLNKIRWLSLSLEEFEACPKKSVILTEEEIDFISRTIQAIDDICSIYDKVSDEDYRDECKMVVLNHLSRPDCHGSCANCRKLEEVLRGNVFPFSISNRIEKRKKIQLRKIYCPRFIDTEVEVPFPLLPKDLYICTYVVANKSVRLTAVYLSAKTLPLPRFTSFTYADERKYKAKLFVTIYDADNVSMCTTSFDEEVSFGRDFKITLPKPVIFDAFREYRIKVDLLNSYKNYMICVRSSLSKFPSSGLRVTFREKANVSHDGSLVSANHLSIISGLELYI